MQFFALALSVAASSLVAASPLPRSTQGCSVELASTLSGQSNAADIITNAVLDRFEQTAQQSAPITSSDVGVTSATPVTYTTTINPNAAAGLPGSMITGVVLQWSSTYLISNTSTPNTDSRGDFYVMDIACT